MLPPPDYPQALKRIEALEKRIAEMAGMLNKASDEAKLQVDNERDACVRKLKSFLEENPEASEDYTRAMKQAIKALEMRKLPAVQWMDEMAHGTKLGEFIEAHVERRVAEELAKRESES